MDGMSWANLTMLIASIPPLETGDNEGDIDTKNWSQYINN
jgi:hypothetical protein